MVLESIQSDLETLARSPPGTSAGASLQIPSLKPVGHQSTNLRVAQTRLNHQRPSLNLADMERGEEDSLNGPLGLDVGHRGIHILGHTVPSVQETTSHVLPLTRIGDHHLVGGFETGVGHLGDRVGLVEGWRDGRWAMLAQSLGKMLWAERGLTLLSTDNRRVRGEREVDTRETTRKPNHSHQHPDS